MKDQTDYNYNKIKVRTNVEINKNWKKKITNIIGIGGMPFFPGKLYSSYMVICSTLVLTSFL